jgi:hypothetical protein
MASKYTLSPVKKLPATGSGRTTADVLFDVGRAIGQGLTFGTSDELEAFVRSKFTESGKSFDEELDTIRSEMKSFSDAHPYTALGLEIAGSLPSAIGLGRTLAKKGIQSAAKIGGLEGAAYGAGSAEGGAGDRASGAITSGALGMAGGKLAEKITPKVLSGARSMLEKGYDLTPGQTYGGAVKSIEEGVSLPFMQDIIKGQQRATRQQFNRKTVEDALSGLNNAELAKDLTGENLVERASEIVSDNYEAILPRLSIDVAPLQSKIQSIVNSRVQAQALSPADLKELNLEIADLVTRHATDGKLSKQILKDVESSLGDEAFKASNRRIGRALKEVQSALRDEIFTQNPNVPDLQKVNTAFRKLVPIEKAKAGSISSGGEFTPTKLLMQKEMKQLSPLAPEKVAARQARDIIGVGTGSSGTAERLMRSSPFKTALGLAGSIPTSLLYGGVGGRLGRKSPQLPGDLLRAVTPVASTKIPGLLSTEAQAGSIEDMAVGGNIVGYETVTDRQGNPVTFAKTSDGRAVRVR